MHAPRIASVAVNVRMLPLVFAVLYLSRQGRCWLTSMDSFDFFLKGGNQTTKPHNSILPTFAISLSLVYCFTLFAPVLLTNSLCRRLEVIYLQSICKCLEDFGKLFPPTTKQYIIGKHNYQYQIHTILICIIQAFTQGTERVLLIHPDKGWIFVPVQPCCYGYMF